MYRTDRNRNPTAFTTALAREGGLKEGKDYEVGDSFRVEGKNYYTAKLLGDPVDLTLRLIDKVGFYTRHGKLRWNYIGIPHQAWRCLPCGVKLEVLGWMYSREGGTELKFLFRDHDGTA